MQVARRKGRGADETFATTTLPSGVGFPGDVLDKQGYLPLERIVENCVDRTVAISVATSFRTVGVFDPFPSNPGLAGLVGLYNDQKRPKHIWNTELSWCV